MKYILAEGKKVLELAVSKCLTGANLTEKELKQILDISERDLMNQYGCDFIMTEKIKTHAKQEQYRQRAQNLYVKPEKKKSGYPKKPSTRTSPITESKKKILEFSDKEMVSYISQEISGKQFPDVAISVTPPVSQIKTTLGNPNDNLLEKRLTQYLGMLRCMHLWFHGAHHATRGSSFVADHSLYSDIYNMLSEEIDSAIEKAVGTTNNEGLSCPKEITSIALSILCKYPTPSSTSSLAIASTALQIEKDYTLLVSAIFEELDSAQLLSLGLNDFLMGSANSHGTHIYKLQQRVKSEIEN